ncbi:Toxoplasma gondii family C protein, partial [Toxoplasma gondii ARI]
PCKRCAFYHPRRHLSQLGQDFDYRNYTISKRDVRYRRHLHASLAALPLHIQMETQCDPYGCHLRLSLCSL